MLKSTFNSYMLYYTLIFLAIYTVIYSTYDENSEKKDAVIRLMTELYQYQLTNTNRYEYFGVEITSGDKKLFFSNMNISIFNQTFALNDSRDISHPQIGSGYFFFDTSQQLIYPETLINLIMEFLDENSHVDFNVSETEIDPLGDCYTSIDEDRSSREREISISFVCPVGDGSRGSLFLHQEFNNGLISPVETSFINYPYYQPSSTSFGISGIPHKTPYSISTSTDEEILREYAEMIPRMNQLLQEIINSEQDYSEAQQRLIDAVLELQGFEESNVMEDLR